MSPNEPEIGEAPTFNTGTNMGTPGDTDHRLGLADDERAISLPATALPLAADDIVELVGVGLNGDRVATESLGTARVLVVDDRSVTVALHGLSAMLVLQHQATGSVEIILTPDTETRS